MGSCSSLEKENPYYTYRCFWLNEEQLYSTCLRFLLKSEIKVWQYLTMRTNLQNWFNLVSISKNRCWVAAHMCVLSHFRTCDVRAEVGAERVLNCVCESACVWANFKVRFAIALFYLHLHKRCNF